MILCDLTSQNVVFSFYLHYSELDSVTCNSHICLRTQECGKRGQKGKDCDGEWRKSSEVGATERMEVITEKSATEYRANFSVNSGVSTGKEVGFQSTRSLTPGTSVDACQWMFIISDLHTVGAQ